MELEGVKGSHIAKEGRRNRSSESIEGYVPEEAAIRPNRSDGKELVRERSGKVVGVERKLECT